MTNQYNSVASTCTQDKFALPEHFLLIASGFKTNYRVVVCFDFVVDVRIVFVKCTCVLTFDVSRLQCPRDFDMTL